MRKGTDRLVRIAKDQRAVLVCVLLYIVLSIAISAIAAGQRTGGLRVAVMVINGVLALVMLLFAVRLALNVFGYAGAVVCGLIFVSPIACRWLAPAAVQNLPMVVLITLVVINVAATRQLKRNGVRVGLLGARSADVIARTSVPTDVFD